MFLWLMNCPWVNKDYLSIYLSDYSQTCIKQSPTENDRLLQVPQNWGMKKYAILFHIASFNAGGGKYK